MENNFLARIQKFLCAHSREFFRMENRIIGCTLCGHTVDLVQDVLLRQPQENVFYSVDTAFLYAQTTNDYKIPCLFFFHGIPGILPTVFRTDLNTFLQGRKLLNALCSPFHFGGSGDDHAELFKNFLEEYVTLIDRFCAETDPENPDEETATVRSLLSHMKSLVGDVDVVNHYFKIFTPYVKARRRYSTAAGTAKAIEPPPPPTGSLGNDAHEELSFATRIRTHYAPFCVPFDVVHIMVLCYLCGNESDLVANLVFDLMARVCNRYFHAPPDARDPLVKAVRRHYDTFVLKPGHVAPRNASLYFLSNRLREGGLEDHLSEEFVLKYFEWVKDLKRYAGVKKRDELNGYHFNQTFPYVLMSEKDEEYYGFVSALAHYVSQMSSNGRVPKWTLKASKRIYLVVKKFIGTVRKFDPERTQIWTKDVFQLFLSSDENIRDNLTDLMKTMSDITRSSNGVAADASGGETRQ